MIIGIYTDEYQNEYVATGENIEDVIKILKEEADEDINMDSLKVFTGVPVKVTKIVSYAVEKT